MIKLALAIDNDVNGFTQNVVNFKNVVSLTYASGSRPTEIHLEFNESEADKISMRIAQIKQFSELFPF